MPQGEYLQYGGQAIVEGVMMRSPRFFSVACRAPNGEIVLRTEALEKTWIGRQKWLKIPFLRGSLALLDAMALGIRAMRFASDVQLDPQYSEEGPPAQEESEGVAGSPVVKSANKIQDASIAIAMVFGLALGIFVFNLLPNLISAMSSNYLGIKKYTGINLITEVIKVIFFLGYIWLIGRVPEIRKVFMYHGAEHKAINTLEADQELNLENCQNQTRLHPRCGTSFAIVVLIVSFVFFTFIPRPVGYHPLVTGLLRFLMEVPLLLVVAGISYEAIRLAGKFRNSAIIKLLFAPGLASQYLTTVEPKPDQIEVALEALKAVVVAEGQSPHTAIESDALESSPLPVP